MRRNYGSLDLSALDLHAPGGVDGLARQLAALDPCAVDADGAADGAADSSDELARCVGLPLERIPACTLAAPTNALAASPRSPPVPIRPPASAADAGAARRKRSISTRGLDDDADLRISNKLAATAEWPQRLREQHAVELGALRCLSLKVMLSSLSTAPGAAPGDEDPAAAANEGGGGYGGYGKPLLPLRRPAIPCNMLQSA